MFITVEKNSLFDPTQISLFSEIDLLFQSQGIADSFNITPKILLYNVLEKIFH
jgi:hypothetical protein